MASNSSPTTRTYMTEQQKKAAATTEETGKRKLWQASYVPWLIVIILIALSVFLYLQYRSAQHKLTGVSSTQYEKRLEKIILLPHNETPITRVITNASSLKGQTFFHDAANGDILFVYNNAHKAVLYRPSTNMIVNVETVNLTPSNTSP